MRRVVPGVLAAVILASVGYILLDRYDIPSYLIKHVPRWTKSAKLRIDPIRFSDERILSEATNAIHLDQHLNSDSANTWSSYFRHRRSARASSAIMDSSSLTAATELFEKAPEAVLDDLLSESGEWADGVFRPFGTGPYTLYSDFDWNRFPAFNGDRIFLWELSALQHFPRLAQAYLVTGETRYREAILSQLKRWRADNPVDNSMNWVAAMEVSLRLISLVITSELLQLEPPGAEVQRELVRAIYDHMWFLEKNIDEPRKFNNHGIFAPLGLYVAAREFPEFDDSDRSRTRFAEARLLEELNRQYTEQGVHVEYVPMYHKALLDGYLLYALIKTRLGEPMSNEVRRRLASQLNVLKSYTGPDGRFALIGDSDDHHVYDLGGAGYRDTRPTFLMGNLILGYPTQSLAFSLAEALWDAPLWLIPGKVESVLGGSREQPSIDLAPVRASRVGESGYFRLDGERFALLGTFSTFGASPQYAGHSHSDMGSFVLWWDGEEALVDAGTYTYRKNWTWQDISWRDYLRSSQSQNVVTVDGQTQAQAAGDFGFKSWPQADLLVLGQQDDVAAVVGEHWAYRDLVGVARRAFVHVDDVLVIADWFPTATEAHHYESRFLFTAEGARDLLPRIAMVEGDWRIKETLTGQIDPPAGWMSPSYGTIDAAPQHRLSTTKTGPAFLAVFFDLRENASNLPFEVTVDSSTGVPTLTITRQADLSIIYIIPEQASTELVYGNGRCFELVTGPGVGVLKKDGKLVTITGEESRSFDPGTCE